jgi:hypothetical protein
MVIFTSLACKPYTSSFTTLLEAKASSYPLKKNNMINRMCGSVFQAQVVEKLEDFIEVSNGKIDDLESQL